MLPVAGLEGGVCGPRTVSIAGGVGVVAGGADVGGDGLTEGGAEAGGELTVGVEGLGVEGLPVVLIGVSASGGEDEVEPEGEVAVGDCAGLGVD